MLTDQTTDNPIRELSEEEDLTDELTREDTCVRTLTVPEEMNGRRLDLIMSTMVEDCSRSVCQKMIEDGLVTCGDSLCSKPGQKMRSGQVLTVRIPQPEEITIEAQDIPLDILYEDDDLIVVNKPKGMVVHPAPGH